MEEPIFYGCSICGNLVFMMKDSGVIPVCCGKQMEEVRTNTSDASLDKHIPLIERRGNRVKLRVGRDSHPMIREHYTEWVALLTGKGFYLRSLSGGQMPETVFTLEDFIAELRERETRPAIWKQRLRYRGYFLKNGCHRRISKPPLFPKWKKRGLLYIRI